MSPKCKSCADLKRQLSVWKERDRSCEDLQARISELEDSASQQLTERLRAEAEVLRLRHLLKQSKQALAEKQTDFDELRRDLAKDRAESFEVSDLIKMAFESEFESLKRESAAAVREMWDLRFGGSGR